MACVCRAAGPWTPTVQPPGRLRRLALLWLARTHTRLAQADRLERAAEAAYARGDGEAGYRLAHETQVLREGYGDGEAARQARLREGESLWEERYGRMDSPEVKAKLAQYAEALAAEELKKRTPAAPRAPVKRRRRGP